jgi:hypothetical protein
MLGKLSTTEAIPPALYDRQKGRKKIKRKQRKRRRDREGREEREGEHTYVVVQGTHNSL